MRIAFVVLVTVSITNCASTETRVDSSGTIATEGLLQQAKAAYNAGNYNLAVDILTRLVQQGDDEAMYALGHIYFYGNGIPKDQNNAVTLFSEAAKRGNKKAIEALTMLSRSSVGQQDVIRLTRNDGELTENPGEPNQTELELLSTNNNDNQDTIPLETESDPLVISQSRSGIQENSTGTGETSIVMSEDMPMFEPVTVDETPYTLEWLEKQDRNHYTIQLASGYDADSNARYIRTYELQNKAMVVSTNGDANPSSIIVYGVFPTLTAARQALRELPPALSRNQPWIRNLSDLF